MRKSITASIAVVLAFSSGVPAIFAAEQTNEVSPVVAKVDKKQQIIEQMQVERPMIEKLTLQDAIKYGMESDFSLTDLDYALKELRYNEDVADENFDDVDDNLDALKEAYEALSNKIKSDKENPSTSDSAGVNVANYDKKVSTLTDILQSLDIVQLQVLIDDPTNAGNPNVILESLLKNIEKFLGEYKVLEQTDEDKLKEMSQQIYTLTQAYEQLKAALDQIELNLNATYNNQRLVYQATQVSIASQYLSLVKIEDQLALAKANYENEQRNLKAMQVKFELGMASQKQLNTATREFNDLSKDIALLEKSLKQNKAIFALTIGVGYEGDYELEKPKMDEVKLLTQQETTANLVDKSLNIASAEFQLLIAEDNYDYVEDKDDSTRDERQVAKLAIEKAAYNIEKTKINLDKAIQTTFFQVVAQYKTVQDAAQALQVAKDEIADLQVYYDLGMISKLQFEASSLMVQQAQMNYDSAVYDYYLLQRKVEAMYNGVIITG
ncbi:MAG: TolC family protein [Solibacillus sp.]